MLIKHLNGEFELLSRIIRRDTSDASVVVGNGDDAAVIKINGELLAVSTDSLIEGRHFNLEYFTGKELGERAFECAASDIAAMGGKARYVFVSIALRDSLEVKLCEEIYAGLYAASERANAVVLGGDTTRASEIALTITVLGTIQSDAHICTRKGAKNGDVVFVSGELGGSKAGLLALQQKLVGFDDLKKLHRTPRARFDLVDAIAPHATSMIDISDGLSSELQHIANESRCGILVYEDKIPVSASTRNLANLLGCAAYELAYSGGEDFELLYTIESCDRRFASGFEIGTVCTEQGVFVERAGGREPLLASGFDHFK